ncbi:hypothetical protein CDAR_443441 [Caerostris darwini]|uniref:Uncharacterized protein n=1 Tax=Caerostris darwini TaxID=1538125 RepID=A0AAV4R4W0_9ARAC|nr:hypothetical protein CDAR_443441 [Caerostris darwini]
MNDIHFKKKAFKCFPNHIKNGGFLSKQHHLNSEKKVQNKQLKKGRQRDNHTRIHFPDNRIRLAFSSPKKNRKFVSENTGLHCFRRSEFGLSRSGMTAVRCANLKHVPTLKLLLLPLSQIKRRFPFSLSSRSTFVCSAKSIFPRKMLEFKNLSREFRGTTQFPTQDREGAI